MFESGTYKSLPEHVALYEALESSIEHANRDEFLAEKDKSRKRQRDDQDPPSPPPKDSNQNKNKRHDFDASGSKQPPDSQSSAWKTSSTREAPSSSSKQKFIKNRPDWLKPVPEEDRPATPETDWVIPPNELPETENN
ncbi:hypothetical protein Tco_1038044 [Tanacetum coccineum]